MSLKGYVKVLLLAGCFLPQDGLRARAAMSFHGFSIHVGLLACCFSFQVISPVAASLTEGDLRLVDGGRDNQGRIEIYFNDTWWRLCKHHFNERAFTSVCRTLGLPDPEWEFRDSEFGRGNYSYLPRDFECDSEDTPLLKCRDEGYHDHHCSEEATVGVSCGELVHLECDGGSNRTDMFGTLHFMKGSKPQERRCEWIIGNEGDPKGDHIIINTYVEKGAKCGTHVNIKRFPDDHIHHSDVCRERTTQIIEFEASKVVVEIDQHHIDDVSFDGAYVFLQGSYESAQHVSGWDVSVTNITEDSLRIEWTVLTSEIDQPVEVYVVIVASTTRHDYVNGRIVTSSISSLWLHGLIPYHEYRILVVAVDVSGRPHKSNETTTTTDESVPMSGPHIHEAYPDEKGCVKVKWDPISENERGGLILGYTLSYIPTCSEHDPENDGNEGNVTVDGSTFNASLCNLRPGTRYRLELKGYTSKGYGPPTDKDTYASCGEPRILTEVNGTIDSPNKPCEYGGKQNCLWSIRPNVSEPVKNIWMTFKDFRLVEYEHDKGCGFNDWVGISTGDSGTPSLVCRHFDHFHAIVSGDQADVKFFAQGREDYRRDDGFHASYYGLDEIEETYLESWNFSSSLDSWSADLSWGVFPPGGDIQSLYVRFTQKNVSIMVPVNEHDTSYRMKNLLMPNRDYVLDVVAFVAGDKMYLSQNDSVTTPEGAPSRGPDNVHVELLQHNRILVTWDAITREVANGQLRGYTVFVKDYHDHDPESATKYNVSSSETWIIIDHLDGGRKYTVAVTAFTIEEGPHSEWQEFIVGCGGNLDGYFASFKLQQWDWHQLECTWKLNNPGVTNAVLVISAFYVKFESCGSWSKIYSSDGTELHNHDGCDHNNHRVYGEIVEVSFEGSDFLTLKLHTDHQGSFVRSEFVILEEGKSLNSAHQSPEWNIAANISSDGAVLVDLSGHPDSKVDAFFIVSINETQRKYENDDDDHHHHHHDDDFKPRNYLHMVNSSETIAKVMGLPAFTNFTISVYLVEESTHELYQSKEIQLQTEERVPSEGPPIDDYWTKDGCVEISWHPISEERRNGFIQGYNIHYELACHNYQENGLFHTGRLNVSSPDTLSATVCDLYPGLQYRVGVAGFTSKGVGEYSDRDDIYIGCGGPVTLTNSSGMIASPNQPCSYGGVQNCHWSITPDTDEAVKVIWMFFKEFRLEEYEHNSNCRSNDWVGISTKGNVSGVSVCRHREDFIAIIMDSHADVSFHTRDKYRRGDGFYASYEASHEDLNVTQLSWTVRVTTSEISADLEWDDFPLGVSITQYYVRFTDQKDNVSVLLPVNGHDKHYSVERLLVSSHTYIFDVLAFTGEEIGSLIYASENVTAQTIEGVPSESPDNLHLEELQRNSVLIQWDQLPSHQANGQLRGYTVYFRDHHNHDERDYKRFNVTFPDTHIVLHGLDGGRKVDVAVAAFTFGYGPRSDWETIRVGCEGTFNSYIGEFNVTQWNWEQLHCEWRIYNPGLTNPVLYLSGIDVRIQSCEGYTKVFKSDGSEIFNYDGCSHALGDVGQVPFDGSSYLTLVFHTNHEWSYARSQFAILEQDEYLYSAPSSPHWDIPYNTTASGVLMDLSDSPGSIDTNLFIITLNKTKEENEHEHHDYDNNKNKKGYFMFMVNATEETADLRGLPVLSNFSTIVYLVDKTNQIYKSPLFHVQTDEGVPSEGPHIEYYEVMADGCVVIKWNEISEENRNGKIIGFRIFYETSCYSEDDPRRHTGSLDVNDPSERHGKVCHLRPGLQYRIRVAGFTSKGVGRFNDRELYTGCGEPRVLTMVNGTIDSPNKPCQYVGKQKCLWSIRPNISEPIKNIWMTFKDFSLEQYEYDKGCWLNDWVSISTGDSGTPSLVCRHFDHFHVVVSSDQADVNFFAQGREDHRRGDGFHSWYHGLFDEIEETYLNSWSFSSSLDSLSADLSWGNFPLDEHVHGLYVRFTQDNVSIMVPVSEHETSYRLENLLMPNRDYILNVVAFAEHNMYFSHSDSVTTPEGAPSKAPPNVRVELLDPNGVKVTWDPLAAKYANGRLVGYKVHIRDWKDHYQWGHDDGDMGEVVTVNSTDTHLVLEGLDGGRKYQISVAAFTVEDGPISDWETVLIGCGGTFHGYFGTFNLTQWSWDGRLDCSWRINNPGLSDPVMIISAQYVELKSCESSSKIFGSDGSELWSHDGCDYRAVKGEIVEVPFDGSNSLTLKLHTEHEGSVVISEFVILEQGKALYSATPFRPPWNVTASNTKKGSVMFDMSRFPNDKEASFFIISLNSTEENPSCGEHHGDDEKQPPVYLHMVNSSNSVEEVFGIPESSRFEVVVYLVSTKDEVYKSEQFLLETVEGVPSEGPGHVEYRVLSASSVFIEWSEISSEHHKGKLLGYSITYFSECTVEDSDSHHFEQFTVDLSFRSHTITSLQPGSKYRVYIAGFTARGVGAPRDMDFTTPCGEPRELTEVNGTIYSPNYPCRFRGPQYCRWTIKPSGPTKIILITIENFRLDRHEYCSKNTWLSVTAGRYNNDTLLCGHIDRFDLVISNDEAEIGFYTREHNEGDAFRAWYQALENDIPETHEPSWSLRVDDTEPTTVQISFDDFVHRDKHVDTFFVKVTEAHKHVSMLVPFPTHERSRRVEYLSPNRKYFIQIMAFTDDGMYTSENISARTDEGAPTMSPLNVRAESLSEHSVRVRFNPIPLSHHNGPLQGYNVYYRNRDHHHDHEGTKKSISASERQVVIDGLQSMQEYEISMSAFNDMEGPRSDEIEVVPGCGGVINKTAAVISLYKTNWDTYHCKWRIYDNGVRNAVLLLSVQYLRFHSCGYEYAKVYSEDGIALHHKDCSTVRGEVHEVPFGSSDVVHSEVFIQNMESKIVTDLVILKGGLHSAQPTQVPWNIKGNEGSDFISLDWSGFPGNLGVNFFVISLNQTELSPYKKDDYHHDDKENKLVRFHKIVNSSETFINITDLPIAAKFIATVYIVNNNNEIYKSEKLMISTEEGVPLRFPHPHDWSTNLDSNTVSFQLNSIERRYRGGEILGYRIIYGPCCDPNNLQTMEVDAGTRRVTLENLTDSLTYAVHIGGYTSKGMGAIGSFGATFCGGDMEADTDQITSPNYPGTPYIGHDQWDENPKCYWNIAPKSSVSGIFLTVRNFLLGRRDEGNRCHGQLRMYFPGISENDENLATDLCGYIPENLTILVIDKVLNLRASGFGYQRYEEEYRDKTKFLIDYEAVKGDITTVTGEAIDSWTGLQMVVGNTYVTVSWPEPPSSFISSSSVDYYQVLVGGWSDRIYVPQNVAAEEKTLKYEWLFPLRNYTLKVITVLKDGRRGCTDWIKFRTTEGVPARNPFIETIEVIDYSTIGVRWHKIDTSYANGIIRGYRVHIIQANDHDCSQGFYDSVTVGPEEIEVTLTGLPAGTDFRVWVTAFTSIGEGHQKHERWVKTKCGAPLHDKKGLIRSREFPSRIKSGDCLWDIYPKNKSVLIHFEHFSLPESDECRDFYATVGDSSGVEPEQICGDREPFDVLVQAKKVLLLSHAEHEAQGDRTGFELHYMTLNHSVSEAELKSGWTITASNVASSTAEIAWSHYSPGAGETLVLYAIVCTPTSHAAGPSITTVKKEIDESNAERLRPYTNYTAKVIALVKNELGEMSLKGSEEVSITTREGVPSKPPEDVAASADDGIITVTWKHIPSDYIHGMLVGYRIYYRLYEGWVDDKELDLNQFSFIEVIDTALEASIVNLTNFETYEVMVAGFTAVGEGPFSERTHSRPGCQTSIRSDMRVISSPGYPDNYPNDVECYWIFEKEMPVFDVVVVIEDFHTEEPDGGANCTNWITDYIGLFNLAPLHVAAGPFCGLQSPFALTAKSYQHRRALLYFRTNNGFAFKGFTSTYFAITDSSKITVSLGAIKNVEVQMTWKSSSDGDKIKEYYILYKPVKEKEIWRFKKTVTLSATLVPLETLTEYDVRVVGYTNGREVYASKVTRFTTKESDDGGEPTKAPEPAPILRMYPYGIDAGDSVITFPSRTECFRIGREKFEIGGFPFFDRRHRKLHICPNGAIQFERDGLNEKAYNFGQRPWLRYFSIIAPYWAPTDLESFKSGPSKVFYHLYDARQAGSIAILENATSDVLGKFSGELPQGKTFNASWVLVVTWKDIRHKVLNDDTKTLHNTFQTLLITDGIFSFTMFNYPHNGIQYSAPTKREYYEYFSNYKQLPVIGWNAGDSDNNYVNYQRSGTVQAETIDNLVGNAKIPGRWIFRLENSNGEEDSDLKCEMWYFKERKALFFYRKEPDPCPCTGVQGYFDDRYEWVEADFPFSYCFYTKFPREGRGRKCCYYTTLDKLAALIIGFPGGGSLHRYHSLTASLKDQHEASDLDGFRYCCLQAKNPLMCRKYYELRPSKGCDGYEPPEWSWLWGDPHIVTLDGQNYTFNGLGEYTMVELQDASFQLQARTKLAKGGGTATVFVAAVAKEKDTSTVQVNLKDEGGLEVLVDSVVYQNYTSLTNISRTLDGSVSVARPENNSFLVAFPSGISVTITEVQGSLSIVFAAPTNLKGKTKGLLGTWNDDVEDDFLRPDNTTLPSNSTGREIHFEFGLKWQVTSDTSLFTYKPGENTSSFVNESFVPIFLDEPIPFASDELKQKAEAVCGGDANCLFDIASTGDVEVGASTKQVAVQLESESQELQNFPPKILVGPTELNITVNTTANVTIVAQDPNNDTITFSVTGTLPKGYTTSTTDSSLSFKWEVTTDKIDIQFIVADATTKTVLQPSINICACQNQGVCAPVEEEDADNSADSNENKFTILSCTCQNGYTGTFCDADLDACEENFQPCYPGVTCNDLPAPANKTGFKCDPCPNGYSGDGIECSDVDECNKNTDGCSDTCINTPGSFVCQCNAGYSLGIDKKTCTDIDECSPVGNCMHVCENTQGSYNCKCNADFKVDPDDSKKCIPMNPCEGNHGCQHVCYQSNGQDKCSCNAGYELNGDGKTCSDVDECSSSDNNRCSQTCKNTVGSYECSCVAGFKLDSDSYACNDIDECMEFTFSCDPSQKCENTPGSYKCVCDEGLYWIDNMCKGLEKGEAPPPPPPASTPRTPTDEEKSESVNVEAALDISLWNAEVEEKFKTTLAEAATTHCATNDDCKSKETGSRRRRAASYVTFTEDQVHLLPGYPKQISVVPLLASLAFYLQFPPGSSAPVIKKDVLAAIIQGSLSELSSSINANISSVQILYADTTTTTTGTTLMTTAIPTEKDRSKMHAIVGGCVAGAVILILVIIAIAWYCNRRKKNGVGKQRVDSERSISRQVSGMEMAAVNDAYMTSQDSFLPGSVEPQYAELKPQYEELKRPENEYTMLNSKR